MTGAAGNVRVSRDASELALATAKWIASRLRTAVGARGRASLVLAGGSTPIGAYRRLAERRVDWDRIDLFWGDERCVAPTDPASNYRMALESLLDPAAVPARNVHRIRGELTPQAGAADYESRLGSRFTRQRPSFDLLLLGLGTDGHTASLFPGDASAAAAGWVTAARSPEAPVDRVSLTHEALGGARQTLFLVSGSAKAEVVARILRTPAISLPAARVAREARNTTWLLDTAAASRWCD